VVAFFLNLTIRAGGDTESRPPRGVPRVAALCPCRSVSILIFLAGGNSKKEWAAEAGAALVEILVWQKRAIVELSFINTLSPLSFMQNQRGFIGIGMSVAILVGLVVLGGGAYYVTHQLSNTIEMKIADKDYNFEYKEGFKFWETTIDPTSPITFKEAVGRGVIEPCTTDKSAEGPNQECRKGPGLIGVMSNPLLIFQMPEDQGYYTRDMRDLAAFPKSFYSKDLAALPKSFYGSNGSFQELYFIVKFENSYLPTYYSVTPQEILGLKNGLMKELNTSSADFAKNFRIVGISYGGAKGVFGLQTYFIKDWVQMRLPVQGSRFFNWQKSVISKEKVLQIANGYQYKIHFDVNNIKIDSATKDLVLPIAGTIDEKSNTCFRGAINLNTGELQAGETACVVY